MRGPGLGACILSLAFWGVATAGAAEVTARLAAPVGEITVGDPVTLLLTVVHPPGTVIDPPEAATLWSGATPEEGEKPPENLVVESLELMVPDPKAPERAGETSWRIHARLFAPGVANVPGIRVHYRLPGSPERGEALTGPITVMVRSVLAKPDEPPADIKGMWRLPADWKSMIMWALALLAALGFVAWLIRRHLARRRKEPLAPALPAALELSAWERAVRELEALLASGLPARGGMKAFHVQLSEIVRRFLGGQHGFDALDRTSAEVMAYLASSKAALELRESAGVFLVACDLVKFARVNPDPAAVDDTVAQARRIIATGATGATGETGRPHAGSEEEQAA